MLAALLYMVYTNLVSIVQAWVAQEKVGVLLGMWSLHAAMLMIVAVMFYLRVSLRPLVLRKR